MAQLITSDGVGLHHDEAGSGAPLVMIPGWSQAAAQFKHQLSGLSDRYRVIALDLRGHGDSERPAHGYRISRLAKDVHDVLEALDLEGVTLLGHSMGCSVIWCYWDLFDSERLAKLVLVDQMALLTANPIWSQAEKEAAGSIFDPDSLYEIVNALAGPDGVATTEGLVGGMVTSAMSEQEKSWIIDLNLKFPREYAARLLYDLSTADWRDTIPQIDIPTLIVSGRAPSRGSLRSGSTSRSRAHAWRSSKKRTAGVTSCSSRTRTSSTGSSPSSSADAMRLTQPDAPERAKKHGYRAGAELTSRSLTAASAGPSVVGVSHWATGSDTAVAPLSCGL